MTQRIVKIADFAVSAGNTTLVTIGLGSCVGIALYEPAARIGALAHVLLPHGTAALSAHTPGKYPHSAMEVMVRRMRELGAVGRIDARLIGGASMFAALLAPGATSLGARNIAAAQAACADHEIPIVAQDVGGAHGRSIFFDVQAGDLLVRSMAVGDVHL